MANTLPIFQHEVGEVIRRRAVGRVDLKGLSMHVLGLFAIFRTILPWFRREVRRYIFFWIVRRWTDKRVRDLPWSEYWTTVVIELYRVRCPDCGIKAEKAPQLPSKAPFSKRFEEAAGRRVARQFGLASSTVRAIDVRYLP